MDIGHGSHDLAKEYSRFVFKEAVFGHDVIEELATRAVLKAGRKNRVSGPRLLKSKLTSRIMKNFSSVSMTWYNLHRC